MFEEEEVSPSTLSKKLCMVAGILLLSLGVLCSFWLLVIVNSCFRAPDRVALLGKMLRMSTEEQVIRGTLFDSPFAITYSNFLSYLVLLIICSILLSAAGRIIVALISGGIEALAIAADARHHKQARSSR